MTAYPLQGALPSPPSERPDEARLALRRAVQATLAGFAEMDRLLDRAEQLISQQRPGYVLQGMLNKPSVHLLRHDGPWRRSGGNRPNFGQMLLTYGGA